MKAKLYKEEFELPQGYKVKTGCEFSESLERYLWNPKQDDLFYHPESETIYVYLLWNHKPNTKGLYFCSIDGYAKIRKINNKRGAWVNNLQVRKNGIPIEADL